MSVGFKVEWRGGSPAQSTKGDDVKQRSVAEFVFVHVHEGEQINFKTER